MPRAANQYNGCLIRPALCPNSNKAAVLNLEKLIEGRPSICADTVSYVESLFQFDEKVIGEISIKFLQKNMFYSYFPR